MDRQRSPVLSPSVATAGATVDDGTEDGVLSRSRSMSQAARSRHGSPGLGPRLSEFAVPGQALALPSGMSRCRDEYPKIDLGRGFNLPSMDPGAPRDEAVIDLEWKETAGTSPVQLPSSSRAKSVLSPSTRRVVPLDGVSSVGRVSTASKVLSSGEGGALGPDGPGLWGQLCWPSWAPDGFCPFCCPPRIPAVLVRNSGLVLAGAIALLVILNMVLKFGVLIIYSARRQTVWCTVGSLLYAAGVVAPLLLCRRYLLLWLTTYGVTLFRRMFTSYEIEEEPGVPPPPLPRAHTLPHQPASVQR